MVRSPFILFALGVLSSSIPSLQGFSTSRLLSSSTLKKSSFRRRQQQRSPRETQRRYFNGGIVLLRVATDPTTVTSHADKVGERSYDFISVEESEEALRRESARYEEERSELQWLLEVQRRQLQDLADGRLENETTDDINGGSSGRNRSGYSRSGDAITSSKRIVILGTHVDANVMNNGKKNRKKGTRGSSRNNTNDNDRKNTNGNDDTYLRMEQLENLLQDAIVENEKLTRRLREHHYQYNVERSEYEDELREERGRLNCVRDELHMERAYFETSGRMLEDLLEEEQQKVRELEKEMTFFSREQVFSQEKQPKEEYQERQRQQQAQKQHMRQEHTHSQINNEERHPQEKRGRDRFHTGFTMNINDVHSPLYP